jgi:hypothetical protein
MPSSSYTRIEITKEAYMGLEAEAVLQGKTLKKLASDLILRSISPKALQFINGGEPSLYTGAAAESKEISEKNVLIGIRRPRISDNLEAIENIRVLWSHDPRPSQREIAKIIDYPASTTKYQIKVMLKNGELDK